MFLLSLILKDDGNLPYIISVVGAAKGALKYIESLENLCFRILLVPFLILDTSNKYKFKDSTNSSGVMSGDKCPENKVEYVSAKSES